MSRTAVGIATGASLDASCFMRIRFAGRRFWENVARVKSVLASSWRRVRRLIGRVWGRDPAPARQADVGVGRSRRELLRALGSLPLLGWLSWPRARAVGAESVDGVSGATITLFDKSEAEEYLRLRGLDLQSPAAHALQGHMPVGKLGGLTLGRLISGSNLISMNLHARDLGYVGELARHYNTQDRIFLTLKKLEEQGVNAIVLKNHNFRQFKLAKYWTDWGGRMKWIADVITTDLNQYERLLVEHLELGAAAAYLWGGASDTWYHQGKARQIVQAYEIMRRYSIPVGIGAHRIEPIAFCEEEGLKPDFYFLTLHHDRYWSAHPRGNRRFQEMYEPDSPDHDFYHDNLFCHDAERTAAYMQDVDVPWIAFKVLAAGAIPPRDGFRYAFRSGADFICVGMFDWQVVEDARLVRDAVVEARSRPRRW